MSLFDLQPLSLDEVRTRLNVQTIRKPSGGLAPVMRTMRHKPWWMLLGKGPDDSTCRTCQHLIGTTTGSGKRFYKCLMQSITNGPGTDIRMKDEACVLFEEAVLRAALKKIGGGAGS